MFSRAGDRFMPRMERSARFRLVFLASAALSGTALVGAAAVVGNPIQKSPRSAAKLPAPSDPAAIQVSGIWKSTYSLKQGDTVEINVGLTRPASLPPNGRIAAEWSLSDSDGILAREGARKP